MIHEDIILLQMQIKLKDMIAKSLMTETVKGTHSDNVSLVRKQKRLIYSNNDVVIRSVWESKYVKAKGIEKKEKLV